MISTPLSRAREKLGLTKTAPASLANSYNLWTWQDDEKLLEALKCGTSWKVIAKDLERSVSACEQHYNKKFKV